MVSFRPSEEQELIRETVASFARERIRPAARQCDESGEIPGALLSEAWDLGLTQSVIPEAQGGMGGDPSAVTGALIAEELGWGDLAIALAILAPRLLVLPVTLLGTPEQRNEVLPAYAADTPCVGTSAFLEPHFQFDANAMETRAERKGSDWVLDGVKCYVPAAAQARQILVWARGESGPIPFVVDADTAGLEVGEREKNMGLKGLATYEVALRDCAVPDRCRLSGDVRAVLNRQRVALAALAVGVARAAFEYARDYAKERRAFGVAIAQKQAIAFMLAQMAIEIDATRLLTWEAAWKIDRGDEATREACLAKNYAAAMVMKVTDDAVQILGGHGYIRDHLVELFLRNGRGFAVFEGLAIA